MAGRRDSCSDREASLISDAGQMLALASANVGLAREFGLSSKSLHLSLDELQKHSLPTPALAVRWPDKLKENWELLDQRFSRSTQCPQRDLALVCPC